MNGEIDEFRLSEPERLPPWQPSESQPLPPRSSQNQDVILSLMASQFVIICLLNRSGSILADIAPVEVALARKQGLTVGVEDDGEIRVRITGSGS